MEKTIAQNGTNGINGTALAKLEPNDTPVVINVGNAQALMRAESVVDTVTEYRVTLAPEEIRAMHVAEARRVLREVYREAARKKGLLPRK